MRVRELKGSFKGTINDNLRVRLDVWGLEKDGTRQANAVAMCYTQTTTLPPDHPPVQTFSGQKCHLLSQPQMIDWTTTEIKPVVEVHLGDRITVEYSRPMRRDHVACRAARRSLRRLLLTLIDVSVLA